MIYLHLFFISLCSGLFVFGIYVDNILVIVMSTLAVCSNFFAVMMRVEK